MKNTMRYWMIVVLLFSVFVSGCGSAYVPASILGQDNWIQQAGMQLTKIEGLSGDADAYVFDETEDASFTGDAAICYNVTKDSVVYSVASDYTFQTEKFSPFSILKSVLEYETNEDYEIMMQEEYMQDLQINHLFRTVKELVNYEEFLRLYQDTTYIPVNSRLKPVAQYDCWDEVNGCMRFLYVKKDGVQDYILLLIGIESDDELTVQTDRIMSRLIK